MMTAQILPGDPDLLTTITLRVRAPHLGDHLAHALDQVWLQRFQQPGVYLVTHESGLAVLKPLLGFVPGQVLDLGQLLVDLVQGSAYCLCQSVLEFGFVFCLLCGGFLRQGF